MTGDVSVKPEEDGNRNGDIDDETERHKTIHVKNAKQPENMKTTNPEKLEKQQYSKTTTTFQTKKEDINAEDAANLVPPPLTRLRSRPGAVPVGALPSSTLQSNTSVRATSDSSPQVMPALMSNPIINVNPDENTVSVLTENSSSAPVTATAICSEDYRAEVEAEVRRQLWNEVVDAHCVVALNDDNNNGDKGNEASTGKSRRKM